MTDRLCVPLAPPVLALAGSAVEHFVVRSSAFVRSSSPADRLKAELRTIERLFFCAGMLHSVALQGTTALAEPVAHKIRVRNCACSFLGNGTGTISLSYFGQLHIHQHADALLLGFVQCPCGCYGILHGHADRLEDSNLPVVFPGRCGLVDQFSEFRIGLS